MLPVRPRANTSESKEAALEGEENAEQTWSPQTDSTHEGSHTTTSLKSAMLTDHLKVTVKNTFIDVETPEGRGVDLHPGGAQSCTARLDAPVSSFLTSPTIHEVVPDCDDDGDDVRKASRRIPLRLARALDFDSAADESEASSQQRFGGVPLFQPADRAQAVLRSPVPAGSSGREGLPLQTISPPTYAAPCTFDEEPTSPAPAQPPRSPPGSKGSPSAWASASKTASTAASPEPWRTRAKVAGLNGDFDEDHHVVVKNTFIDLEDSHPEVPERFAMSCTARFSGQAAQFPAMTPQGVAPGGLASTLQATVEEEPAQVTLAEAPSEGSRLHGQFTAEGQPACQPCAWFYKEASCANGAICRYCHLCPQGELKTRKKLKIQRLRAQDAAAGEAMVQVAMEKVAAEEKARGR